MNEEGSAFAAVLLFARATTQQVGATRLHFVSVFVRLRRDESAGQASDKLRRASNEGTLRAFRIRDLVRS